MNAWSPVSRVTTLEELAAGIKDSVAAVSAEQYPDGCAAAYALGQLDCLTFVLELIEGPSR